MHRAIIKFLNFLYTVYCSVLKWYAHSDDDIVESQELEILNVLDLDLMFGNNSTDKELELDELNDFI